ncbi:hypothetical protein IE077_004193 [Cardiosporidium cionae]|uniref:Uncharacterized protein n=1 Tax=Cardiosporidium cionae TaxID=476202 RepID=A0ABQ7J3L3_9APIC|nr:hypothetical protein IE077_004193 [Cardiosporidium cionae]|eukprot:KAF8817693.1 hypothetical protein IE077_004193 [Cardiosporidium cionae]
MEPEGIKTGQNNSYMSDISDVNRNDLSHWHQFTRDATLQNFNDTNQVKKILFASEFIRNATSSPLLMQVVTETTEAPTKPISMLSKQEMIKKSISRRGSGFRKASILNIPSRAIAFIGMQARGVISTIDDLFFGGTSGTKPENWDGGNQGSFFNYVYPDNSDYPWACLCDEVDYAKWVSKTQEYVRCRNQVDQSVQNVQANCDPENHSGAINTTTTLRTLLITFISLSIGVTFAMDGIM